MSYDDPFHAGTFHEVVIAMGMPQKRASSLGIHGLSITLFLNIEKPLGNSSQAWEQRYVSVLFFEHDGMRPIEEQRHSRVTHAVTRHAAEHGPLYSAARVRGHC